MDDKLHVTLVQYDIEWHDPRKNFLKIESLLEQADRDTDLIVLPEMFCTGFTDKPDRLPSGLNAQALRWLTAISHEKKCMVIGSFPFRDAHCFYNRLYAIASGEIRMYYDKRHLFALGNEKKQYRSGSKQMLIDYKGWKIYPLICYDLRFPVWCRNIHDYDLLLIIANWPASRVLAWDTLLRARAIENQSYVAGLNRTGTDGNNINYRGGSQIIDPTGEVIRNLSDLEGIMEIQLSKFEIRKCRRMFPFLKDRDNFELK